MSPYFIVLALLVASSLLLSLAALVRTMWLGFRQAREATPGARRSPVYSNASDPLLLLAVAMFAAIAQDHMAAEGFSKEQYARLMLSNGVRTLIFTLIGFLALFAMRRRLIAK